MKKITYSFFLFAKSYVWEILIIILLNFMFVNYFVTNETTIKSDGEGYYDYLPSLFIRHDFIRLHTNQKSHPQLYERINEKKCYNDYQGLKVNKYPCGTALLLTPFYGIATIISNNTEPNSDGYEIVYHKWVLYAALFYVFLTLLFFKKILALYNIDYVNITLSQFFLVFSTSILHYANQEAAFSHVYSLFAITAFMYFSKAYFINYRNKNFYWACLFLGLIIILRQVNVIIIFIIPFLAESPENLKTGFETVFKRTSVLIKGIAITACLISIQCIAWYLQTGSLFVYSYQNESFNFFKPELINILFSYKKGLFVYAPILVIALLGLVRLFLNKKFYLAYTWLLFFSVCTYVLSSWWSWFYGDSFGLRAYIDFYSIFFIIFAILLNHLNLWIKTPLLIICLLTVTLNIIQTYQYKAFILHYKNMDKQKYWDIFLKTDDKYIGLVWKIKYDYSDYDTLDVIQMNTISIRPQQEKNILSITCDSIKNHDKCTLIQVSFLNSFNESNNSWIEFDMTNTTNSMYNFNNNNIPLINFKEDKFETYQKGLYNFKTTSLRPNSVLKLIVHNQEDTLLLKKFKVIFFKKVKNINTMEKY